MIKNGTMFWHSFVAEVPESMKCLILWNGNTQAAKDLAEARAYAARLEQQLSHSKKGCLGKLVTIVGFVGLACSLVYLLIYTIHL